MVEAQPKGLVRPGNLTIWNRPVVNNPDGTVSSEYSVSFRDDRPGSPNYGKEVLIPTVIGGKFATPDGKKPPVGSPAERQMFQQAWQHYLSTGENLGVFDTPQNADSYANALHSRAMGRQQPAEIRPGNGSQPGFASRAASMLTGGVLNPALTGRAWEWARGLPINQGRTVGQAEDELGRGVQQTRSNLEQPVLPQVADLLDHLDRRMGGAPASPEEYRNLLIQRGLTPAEAEKYKNMYSPDPLRVAIDAYRSADPQRVAQIRDRSASVANIVRGIGSGGREVADGLLTPENAAILYVLTESAAPRAARMLVDMGFTYQQGKQAVQAFRTGWAAAKKGDAVTAAQQWTAAPVDALFAFLTGQHLMGHEVPGAIRDAERRRAGTETGERRLEEAVQRQRSPLSHPAGEVTGIDQETGLPIVDRRRAPAAAHPQETVSPTPAAAPAEASAGVPHGTPAPPGTLPVEPESGRPVLQGSDDAAAIAAEAKEQAPALRERLEQAVEGVPGARVEAVREQKDQNRVEEKAGAGKPVETQPDHLAARVTAETPEAKEAVAERLAAGGEVQREDNFEKNGGPNDFRADTHQVTVPGEHLRSAEVQIVTPEQHAAAEKTHDLYEQQRTAAAEGDTEKAERLGRQLAEANRQAAEEAEERQKKTGEQPKYKHGNTQADIPNQSEAGAALTTARDQVAPEDLAGDGKDVGGNHVTVRYGLTDDDHGRLREFIGGLAPFEATLGPTESFPPSESSDGAAPVIAPVHSPELHRINEEIERHANFAPSNFPDYRPHATIAYVKPEAAAKYTGMDTTAGKRFLVDRISITDRNGGSEEVRLAGAAGGASTGANSEREGGRGESPEPIAGAAASAPAVYRDFEQYAAQHGASRLESAEPGLERSSQNESATAFARNRERQAARNFALAEKRRALRSQYDEALRRGEIREMTPAERLEDTAAGEGGAAEAARRVIEKRQARTGAQPSEGRKWIGVDLDGTLAAYDGFKGPENIGAPVGPMLDRVKQWLAEGRNVKILTARVSEDPGGRARAAIERWLEQHVGRKLPVTDVKDADMTQLYDDRAVPVERNTGRLLAEPQEEGYGAVREQGAGGVLQRPQEKAKAGGRERGGVEPGQQGAGSAGAQAQAREREGGAVTGLPAPGQVGTMRVADLKADPRRFQYKLNTDASGATNLLKGRRWNPELAGTISVWPDPVDGKVYVVNGHHRYDLARTSGVGDINVLRIDAPTASAARAVGALQNIAEGRGTPVDAAKFFRDSGFTPQMLDRLGVSMGEATAANGLALAKLNDRLFDQVVAGKLRPGRAVEVANATETPEQQDALLKLIDKAEARGRRVTDDTVAELGRMVRGAGEHTETQTDLFGTTENRRNLALEKAEVSAYIRDQIGREKRLFASVSDQGKAEKLTRGENVINAEKNRQIAEGAAQAQELYDRLSTRSGPVDEILTRASRQLAEGGNPNGVKTRAYEDIRRALSEALAPGAGGSGEGVRAAEPEPEAALAQRTQPRGVENWKKGDSFLLRDPKTGRLVSGTIDYFNPSVPGGKPGGRVRLSDGTRLNEIPSGAIRPKTIDDPIDPITGSDLEREVSGRVARDQPGYIARYVTEEKNNPGGVLTIATDAAKDLFPEFRADPVHTDRDVAAAAGRINKAVLETALAMPVDPAKPEVQIMTAAPGSGKTAGNTFEETPPRTGLKIESIMDDHEAARKLLRKIIDSGRRPVVTWVHVDDVGKATERMLRRAIGHDGKPGIGRTVQLNYLASAYKAIPEVLPKLMEEFGDRADFIAHDNSGAKSAPRQPATRDLEPYLDGIRGQTYNQVLGRVREKVQELHDEGLFQTDHGKAALAAAEATDRLSSQNPTSGSGAGGVRSGVGRGNEGVPERPRPGSPVLTSAEKETVQAPAAATGGGGVSEAEFARGLESARRRDARENAAVHQATVIETTDGKAVVMDPDAYALWHRNRLGEKVPWRGVTVPRNLANRIVVALRGLAGTERTRPGGAAPAAGLDRLVDAIGKARQPDGSVTFLRGDYRPDTVREEAWHRWQLANGLDDSDALRGAARDPDFRDAARELGGMGYGAQRGAEGENELAREMMAKALAGDPEWRVDPDPRAAVAKAFLAAAAEEKGPSILNRMPAAAPEMEHVLQEVRDEYGDRGSAQGRGEGVRQEDAGRPVAGAGRPGVGERALHGAGAGEPEGAGGGAGGEAERPDEGELARFQRSRAQELRPEDSLALPGMEDADRERAEARAAQEGQALTAAMREPGKNISGRAGEMERAAPLFEGAGAGGHGFLFQREGSEENPVARSMRDLVSDLGEMPRPAHGTRLEQVSNWLGDQSRESLERTGRAWSSAPQRAEGALARTKAVFAALVDDFRSPPKATGWKRQVGQMQLARTETALQLRGFARELDRVAPDKLARIGMTHWIEAGGDAAKMRDWATKAQQRWEARDDGKLDRRTKAAWRDSVAHYEAAQKLTPDQVALAKRLKQHFDDMLAEAQRNGLLQYGARNYVRHLYEPADAEAMLRLIDNTELSPDPSFIRHRVFQNYFDAEQHGMIPRNKDIGYLVSAYDQSFSHALASRAMLKGLLDEKAEDGRALAAIKGRGKWVVARGDEMPLVLEQRERPKSLEGYREYDLPQTRKFLFEPTVEDLDGWQHDPKLFEEDPGKLAFQGDLIFHPSIASRVEDMLTPGWFDRNETAPQRIGKRVMQGSALAKESMTFMAPFHVVQLGIHALEHMVNPFHLDEIDLSGKTETSRRSRLLAANGLALTDFDAEGLFSARALHSAFEGVPGLNVLLDKVQSFSRWQFENYIPRLKMKMALAAFDRNLKRYPKLDERAVAEITAKQANAAFGNLDTAFDGMHRSKTFKQLLRLSMFAPDFLESRMRFVGQSFTKYGTEQRAALIRGALVMYVAARATNALLNQGDAKWDEGDAFSVVDGQRRWNLRTVQGDILHAVTDPLGFLYNRMNPLTTRPVVEFLSGRDQFGRQKSFPHQVRDEAKEVLPFGVQKILTTPDEGWLDSLMTSTGVQAGLYRTPAEEATHKLYLGGLPDLPDDEEREANARKYRQIEDKLRAGQMKPTEVWAMVKSGELQPEQAARTVARSQQSRLAIEYGSRAVDLEHAVEIFREASPLEKMELAPKLAAKAERQLPEMPPGERAKLEAEVSQLLRELPHLQQQPQRAAIQ